MINSSAIKNFISRKLDDFLWLKKQSPEAVTDSINELTPKPDFGSVKLWLHQQVCFLLLVTLKRFMLHVEMGGGKTALVLMLIKYRKQRGEKPKAIVFVPYITSVETWIEETAKHAPDLKCVPLLGTSTENLAALTQDGDLFVACYQSAVAMVTESVFNKKTKKNKWQLKASEVREYFSTFDMLVCDEIHKCSNSQSLTFRMCRAISSQCEYVLGLTGTPFGRDPINLWGEFYLIDFGETLGDTLGFFRSVFFNEKFNYWGGKDYTFKQKMLPDLQRAIQHSSIHYGIDEIAELPPKVYLIKNIPAPDGAKAYCDLAIKNINEAAGRSSNYHIIEQNYLQLRQLSSGFMTLKGEDDGKLQVKFDHNPKLDVLQELVEGMAPGTKAVIFHHFIFSNGLVSERLKKMKVGHARIWGGQKDPIGELRRFKTDPNCQVLVINWKSGSSSLNLQNANYLIAYEQPDSPIDRKQGEARVWRPGQESKVLIYDLLVKGTVDWRMHKANQQGADLLKQLLEGGL